MEAKEQGKLILAKVNDKIKYCRNRNKIVNTEFLDIYSQNMILKELEKIKEKNYIFKSAYQEAERKILIIYPEKLTQEIVEESINNIINVIKIKLPNEQIGKYHHKDYLGIIMQFGLERERIGDIIVYDDKAYIIVMQENAQYIRDSLLDTRQFKKSKIEIIETSEIEVKEKEFEEIKITINSPRLDNFVSEIAKISRKETKKLIEEEQVIVNYQPETKQTKIINQGDIITIRKKGKFIVDEFKNINRNNKQVVILKKYK